MRPTHLLILGLLSLLVGGILLLEQGASHEGTGGAVPFPDSEVVRDNPPLNGHLASRESAIEKEKRARAWHEVDGFKERLLEAFVVEFINNGGEEQATEFQANYGESFKESGTWTFVENSLAIMQATDLAVSPSTSTIFQSLTGEEMFAASNMLTSQVEHYRQWLSERAKEDGHFPHTKLVQFPLAFAPEMHFEYLSGRVDFNPDVLQGAALLRDKAVRDYAALRLDRAILLPSIEKALASTGVDIPAKERSEAFRAAIPDFDNVMNGIEDVEREYVSALRLHLASYGIEILPGR